MEAKIQETSLMYKPQGIALVILAITGLWCFSPSNPVWLPILVVAILFLVGLTRPVWAMGALLVSQLTITSFMIDTPFGFAISLRLLLLVLTGLILWHAFTQGKIELGPKAKRLLVPALVLMGIATVANMINTDFDIVFREFRNMTVGLLIIIFLPAVVKNIKDLKILCAVAFISVTVSALVGVTQHLGISGSALVPQFILGEQIRIPGIAETELELAYALSTALLAVLGVFLARGVGPGTRRLLVLSALVAGPALYFTYTRSALLALILGLVALFLLMKTRIRGEVVMIVLLLAVALIEITGLSGGLYLQGREEGAQEESTISRQILWQAGMAIAMDNPVVGIGGNQFSTVAPQYSSSVDPSLIAWEEGRYWSYRTLGTEAIHNDFLHMWVSYGTLALVVFIWLFIATMRQFMMSYSTSNKRFIKGLSLGLAAALVAYGVNAFYHNLLATMPLLWILAGFSLVTAKLAAKNQIQKPSVQVNNGT